MRGKPTKQQFRIQLEQFVAAIRDAIKSGELAAGQRLPPERELAAKYGMGNNSIRQGLDVLVAEGWIEKLPRVGNRVSIGRPSVTIVCKCHASTRENLELDALIRHFHRKYPWITVQLESHTYGNEELGNADVMLVNNPQFERLTARGTIHQLTPLPACPDVYPQLERDYMHDGQVYARPILMSPLILCYNKAHFRENGLPEPDGSWTWETMLRAAEQLSDGNTRYGFCFHLPSENRWPLLLLQSGERFERDGDGRLKSLYGTRMMKAIEWGRTIIQNRRVFPQYMSEDNNDINRMFFEGKLSMVLNSYMGMHLWKHTDLDYDISPVPFLYHPASQYFSIGMAIGRNTAHQEEAQLLMDYLISEEGQHTLLQYAMIVPARQSMAGHMPNPVFRVPSRFMLYRETMFSFHPLGTLGIPILALGAVSVTLKAYWANMADEQELDARLREAFGVLQHSRA